MAKQVKVTSPTPDTLPEDLQQLGRIVSALSDTKTAKLFNEFMLSVQKGKSKRYLNKELTKTGSSISRYSYIRDLPVYNPDEISIDTYDRMRKDAQISAGLAVIMMPPLSLNFRVDCPSSEVKAVVEYNIKKLYRSLMGNIMTSVIYGFFHGEKIFTVEHIRPITTNKDGNIEVLYNGYALQISRVKPNHPSTISFILDEYDNLKNVRQRHGGFKVDIPRDKTFLFSHQKEFDNYFGQSRLKPCYKPWYWGELIMQFMLMYLEKMGVPITVVRHPEKMIVDNTGTETSAADKALEVGTAVINNAVVTIPSTRDMEGEYEWDIEFKSSDPKVRMFGDALKFIDNLKLRGMWVPERVLTQDVSGTGAYRLADVHTDVFFFTEGSLITDIEDAINTQIVTDIVQGTFPPSKQYPACIKIEQLNWNRKGILIELFRDIMRGIFAAINNGYIPDVLPIVKEIGSEIGVPIGSSSELYSMFKNMSDDAQNNFSTKMRKAIYDNVNREEKSLTHDIRSDSNADTSI